MEQVAVGRVDFNDPVAGGQSAEGGGPEVGNDLVDTGLVEDALLEDEVQISVLFSTSIYNDELVVLEDDKGMLTADNVTPVLSQDLIDAYGQELQDLIDEISAAIDTDTLADLNKRFDIDREDADDVAAAFIEESGLGEG